MEHTQPLRVLFSGGGTLGPVMPLIATAQELRRQSGGKTQFVWLGTYGGVEHAVVRAHDIEFRPIVAIKWRRYFSIKNIFDVLVAPVACIHAYMMLRSWKPDIVVTAGGYVSVPVHIIAKLMGIPSIVHHQDIQTGLANKIMRRFSSCSTVTFSHTLEEIKEGKGILTGNPIRAALRAGNKDRAVARYKLEPHLPTVLAFGGGTGAIDLNAILAKALPEILVGAQVLHITGQGKQVVAPFIRNERSTLLTRYHAHEFFMDEEMADAYAVADIVICRAGLSTLSEIAALGKPAVLVPIPQSHQEENAGFFKSKQAAVVVAQSTGAAQLARTVQHLLGDATDRMHLAQRVKRMNDEQAHRNMVAVIKDVVMAKRAADKGKKQNV